MPDGKKNVVILGCSHTYGVGHTDDDHWVAHLSKHNTKRLRYWNLGQPGASGDLLVRILYGCQKLIYPSIVIVCWPLWSRRERLEKKPFGTNFVSFQYDATSYLAATKGQEEQSAATREEIAAQLKKHQLWLQKVVETLKTSDAIDTDLEKLLGELNRIEPLHAIPMPADTSMVDALCNLHALRLLRLRD